MDDSEFLRELEQLETAPPADDSAHVRERTLEDMEEGLPLERPDYPRPHVGETAPALPASLAPIDACDLAPEAGEAPRDQRPWMAGGFLMLMMAGAAGAALVFHQRVGHILALMR